MSATTSTESSRLITNKNDKNDDIHSRIASIRQGMQETHNSRVNFRYEWRQTQLLTLRNMVYDNWDEILDALKSDLGKHRTEATVIELGSLPMEINFLLTHLKGWMQPQDKPSAGVLFPAYSKLTPTPKLGPACLVIGPSNYPCSISLMAVAGSLAAGNPTVLKPSELCPAIATLLAKIVPQYFDPKILSVITGGVAETTALLEQSWGLIHFTGSERVGKIVAAAAAKTLTPTVLELGGKCPCFIDETCPGDIRQVADRIVFAKLVNCGQNCISPDYLLVHQSKVDHLIKELMGALKEQFGSQQYAGLGKLVAPSHVKRAIEMIKEVEATNDKKIQILCGGSKECNADNNYVAPTFVLHPPKDCRMMREEIFGPILPIIVVESRDNAIQFIDNMPGTPLAFYCYTDSDTIFTELTERCRSGTAVRCDSLVQFFGPVLPFGGLGTSGIGSYRGKASFDCFSHYLPTIYRPVALGVDLVDATRCQPFDSYKSFVLCKIVPRLPSIPVLKTPKRAILLVVLAIGMAKLPGADAWMEMGRTYLADLLRTAANVISP